MDQVQSFLYSEASRALNLTEITKSVTFSTEKKDSASLNRSLYINRFDDSFKKSNIQAENYSSSIFCDVERDEFWDFLYSDLWDDKFILRVLSGELFTDLDVCLNEMLEVNKISRHVTIAYLRVNNEEKPNKLKFDLSPETIQVQFTYYRKSNSTSSSSISNNFYPFDIGSGKSSSAKSVSENDFDLAGKSASDDLFDTESERDLSGNQELTTPCIFNQNKNTIKISLEHFPCLLSCDIENSIDPEDNALEHEIQEGHWIKNRLTTEDNRLRSTAKTAMLTGVLNGRDKTITLSGLEKTQSKSAGEITAIYKNVGVLKDDSIENLLQPTSIDIDLTNLGKIMEQEQVLNFNEMSLKERKTFFLSDERLQKVRQGLTVEVPDQEQPKVLTKKKSSKKGDKKTVIKDMSKFATLVLGILESPTIYRALISPLKKETIKPSIDKTRSKHAHFGDDEDEDDIDVHIKAASFQSRHTRSLIKRFTYHPKVFTPQHPTPIFHTNRLRRSYSHERFKTSYGWEKRKSAQSELCTLTKVIIPEFADNKHTLDPGMFLKALDDFIVRKECVVSSKGSKLISITFIRPLYLNKLVF